MRGYHEGYGVDDAFDRDYRVEVLVDPPTSPTVARYGSGSGAVLEITPLASSRYVVTVADRLEELQLLSWPDPAVLVALPSTTLVDTRDPGAMRTLPGLGDHPVRFIHRCHAPDAVVVASCCGIACFDANGLRWQRNDVFCCDEASFEVRGDDVIVTTFVHGVDAPDPVHGEVPTGKRIDLATGERRP